MTKIVAIVQARMGSTRLPGKILKDMAGAPMLARVLSRLGRARRLDAVMVATTTQPADDQVEAFCRQQGVEVFRGSENDVLDRYRAAARLSNATAIVRVTSDCPLIDPGLVDDVIASLFTPEPADYASNTLEPRTYPRGLDVEAFTLQALEMAWRRTSSPTLREHVTPYFYLTPEQFALRRVFTEPSQAHRRWTVDTPEDYEFACKIYEHFRHNAFTWHDVLHLVEREPRLEAINSHVPQKPLIP
jgi:spore coat polysaccharide biosynthesis protein SpsF